MRSVQLTIEEAIVHRVDGHEMAVAASAEIVECPTSCLGIPAGRSLGEGGLQVGHGIRGLPGMRVGEAQRVIEARSTW